MKAILHIGSLKTGTSTIQNFLVKNRESLKKQKIFVPTRDLTGRHIELTAATFCFETWKSGPWFPFFGIHVLLLKEGFTTEDQDKLWKNIDNEIKTNCHKDDIVIFTEECLSFHTQKEVEKVKKLMDSLFDDITVVLYLRRQPEFLVSYYYTLNWNGMTKNIFDYLKVPEEYSNLAYHKIVERWSIFGKDKLKIRIFDKQEFHSNDLLADFANTINFNMTGLERVKNQNISIDSATVEFLRLLNLYYPAMQDPWTHNTGHWSMLSYIDTLAIKNHKAYHLNRSEARQILDQFREGNDWVAREYLGREKLFDEDVSMYPVEVDSPHGLTLEKCAEITAHLYKEQQAVINQQQTVIAHHQAAINQQLTVITQQQDHISSSYCFVTPKISC